MRQTGLSAIIKQVMTSCLISLKRFNYVEYRLVSILYVGSGRFDPIFN